MTSGPAKVEELARRVREANALVGQGGGGFASEYVLGYLTQLASSRPLLRAQLTEAVDAGERFAQEYVQQRAMRAAAFRALSDEPVPRYTLGPGDSLALLRLPLDGRPAPDSASEHRA